MSCCSPPKLFCQLLLLLCGVSLRFAHVLQLLLNLLHLLLLFQELYPALLQLAPEAVHFRSQCLLAGILGQ